MVQREDGFYYNELETRVRLSKRRLKAGQQASNSKLVVKHRPMIKQELKMQRYRERNLEPPNEVLLFFFIFYLLSLYLEILLKFVKKIVREVAINNRKAWPSNYIIQLFKISFLILTLGAVHKRRRNFLCRFWYPDFYSKILQHWNLIPPPPLKYSDVFYWHSWDIF